MKPSNSRAFGVSLAAACALLGCADQPARNSEANHEPLPQPTVATAQQNAVLIQYLKAIQAAVTASWMQPDGMPDAPCIVHIVQLPGGAVASAVVEENCPYDDIGRRSVQNAVLRASPLPYKGFESVWMRRIDFTFRPELAAKNTAKAGGRGTPGTVTQIASDRLPPTRPASMNLTYRSEHPPRFPPEALRAGHYGNVVVMALIGVDGRVLATKVEQSSGYPELDDSAVTAVNGWKYRPCYQGGDPQACWIREPVNFPRQAAAPNASG